MPPNRGGGSSDAGLFSCAQGCSVAGCVPDASTSDAAQHEEIFLGDGGDRKCWTAIRAHANFMEFVPLCSVLITCERLPRLLTVAILSIALLLARALHAGGLLGFIPLAARVGASSR